MKSASGYAVVQGGEILVKTVSPTRLAAIINHLVVSGVYNVRRVDPEELILSFWNKYKGDAECFKVSIITVPE